MKILWGSCCRLSWWWWGSAEMPWARCLRGPPTPAAEAMCRPTTLWYWSSLLVRFSISSSFSATHFSRSHTWTSRQRLISCSSAMLSMITRDFTDNNGQISIRQALPSNAQQSLSPSSAATQHSNNVGAARRTHQMHVRPLIIFLRKKIYL